MANDGRGADYGLRALLGRGAIGRLAAIAATVEGVALAFAYAAGWLSPDRLSPVKVVDRFERVSGGMKASRRNHAKGILYSRAFREQRAGCVPVLGLGLPPRARTVDRTLLVCRW